VDPHHFEFGTDLRLPGLQVFADGRVRTARGGGIVCAPYFELVPTAPDELPPAERLSHFIARPFSGHEWNHFALYVIQRAATEVVRCVAFATLPERPTPEDPQWERAGREAIEESFGCLERYLRVYYKLLGRANTRRVVEATRTIISSRSFVAAREEEQSPASDRRPQRSDLDASTHLLDATYLHASFAVEAFHAFLDVRVLEAQGIDPGDCLYDRAAENPLLSRLLAMSSSRATRFLVGWHRKSYRFPRFAKRFFRTAAKLPVRHVKFGVGPGEGGQSP